jgi:hypothetical protein
MANERLMAPGRREPSIEAQRFRMFLEQLCFEYGGGDPHDYGPQRVVRELLGWRDIKKQSKISQYLSDESPKWAGAKSVEKALEEFRKSTGQRISYDRFFKAANLKETSYKAYLIDEDGNPLTVPAEAPKPAATPAAEPEDPAVIGLEFAKKKKLKSPQISKLLDKIREMNLRSPQPRELEILYNTVIAPKKKGVVEDMVRNRKGKLEREAQGGVRVDLQKRPAPRRATKKTPSRKRKPPLRRDAR